MINTTICACLNGMVFFIIASLTQLEDPLMVLSMSAISTVSFFKILIYSEDKEQ